MKKKLKNSFNVFRNGKQMLLHDVDKKTAKKQYETLKSVFDKNKVKLTESKNSFSIYGVTYSYGKNKN